MGAEDLLPSLKAVAEPTRLRMLELLVGIGHALVSHHLRILKEAGVVESEKRGRWTVYRARPEPLTHLARRLAGMAAPRPGHDTRAA